MRSLWSLFLPPCRGCEPICQQLESPQIHPNCPWTRLWRRGSAALPGLLGCGVIGLGAMTHFPVLSSMCHLQALSPKRLKFS